MLSELESHRLEVQLVPLNPRLRNYCEGGCKRVVTDRPVAWYRALCKKYPSSRGVRRGKFDTRIKRRNVLTLLGRLTAGKTSVSKYVDEILKISHEIR